jgi:competence protein CoiA
MIYALNEKNERIHIKHSNKEDDYICPACKSPVVRKVGSVNIHHFSHKNLQDCQDSNDMSEWHLDWQESFPEVNREVVIKNKVKEDDILYHNPTSVYFKEFRRADICINNKIIEFQHSSMSIDEFQSRNDFYYKNNDYDMYWVFDANCWNVEEYYTNKWIWKYPSKRFKWFIPQYEDIKIYFEYDDMLYLVTWAIETEFDSSDFRRFCTEEPISKEEFIKQIMNK